MNLSQSYALASILSVQVETLVIDDQLPSQYSPSKDRLLQFYNLSLLELECSKTEVSMCSRLNLVAPLFYTLCATM